MRILRIPLAPHLFNKCSTHASSSVLRHSGQARSPGVCVINNGLLPNKHKRALCCPCLREVSPPPSTQANRTAHGRSEVIARARPSSCLARGHFALGRAEGACTVGPFSLAHSLQTSRSTTTQNKQTQQVTLGSSRTNKTDWLAGHNHWLAVSGLNKVLKQVVAPSHAEN